MDITQIILAMIFHLPQWIHNFIYAKTGIVVMKHIDSTSKRTLHYSLTRYLEYITKYDEYLVKYGKYLREGGIEPKPPSVKWCE